MAITWRNIEAPDLRGVGALMGQANAGITNMGNAFQTALTDWNTNQQKKVDEQKTQNTDAFLNNLYANYNSPEALKAAISSGEFGRQIAGYGANIDSAKVRGAPEALLGSRQQQALTGMEFDNKVIANADAPTQALYQANALKGTPEALAENEALMQQLNPINRGAAAAFGFDAEGKWINRRNTQASEGRAGEKHLSDLNKTANDIEISKSNAKATMMNAVTNSSQAATAARSASIRDQLGMRTLRDLDKADNAEEYLSKADSEYRKKQNTESDKLHKAAADYGIAIPLDAAGRPNWTRLDEGAENQLSILAKTNGINSSLAMGGDTAVRQLFLDDAASKFGARAARAAAANMGDSFNSGPVKAHGADAAREAAQAKAREESNDVLKARFGNYSNASNAGEARKTVATALKEAGVTGDNLTKYTAQAMEAYQPYEVNGKVIYPGVEELANFAIENANWSIFNPGSWFEGAAGRSRFGNPANLKGLAQQAANTENIKKLKAASGGYNPTAATRKDKERQ